MNPHFTGQGTEAHNLSPSPKLLEEEPDLLAEALASDLMLLTALCGCHILPA